MNDVDVGAFRALFNEACLKCFGHRVEAPLTETESRLLYTRIFEETGLIVGAKSIKNYSIFVFSPVEGKEENPSVATLDTLSRYVLGAPYTTEPERKKAAGHYPYWYRWREEWMREKMAPPEAPGNGGIERKQGRSRLWWKGAVFVLLALVIGGLTLVFRQGALPGEFRDDFTALSEDSMAARGWMVVSKDTAYWKRRAEQPGCLTLYTLKGDNWPDPAQQPVIHNLVMRRIPCDCFTLELHFAAFIPRQNWQQAGILLSEDTGLSGRSMRISILYNDFNGVYPRSGFIILQAITSLGAGSGKPEEIAHLPLFSTDTLRTNPLLYKDLQHTALRIEKQGDRFRILYADGILENSSFKEVASHSFPMEPRYAGLFAIKGFVDSAAEMPARISFFSLDCGGCGK
ncbi:hypothetical protein [Puia dinghuensis]|uniref:Uncharacterized protein n=1 Tax=Puia dinghuensis TaxID=1792502 RepID=A0A8J2XQB9_9BACT|nr:hypothetical protein [Puia dinghuensis]GGA91765.1 hypothetical protein GCM10011511_13910 [Puia dinghuensis]